MLDGRFRRLQSPPASLPVPANGLAARILSALDSSPLNARELLLRTGAESEELDAALDELVQRGQIARDEESAPTSGNFAPLADGEVPLPDGVAPWEGEDMPVGSARTIPPAAGFASEPPDDSTLAPLEQEHTMALHRQLYASTFEGTTVDERRALAHRARGELLAALCFDAEPPVIAALMDNPEFGATHARSVAAHHHNGRGLEILSRRLEWLRDAQVVRNLLKNPQLPESSLNKLLSSKRLKDVYKLCIDRDLPELTRTRVRARLRRSFAAAEPEERVALIMHTEGRALAFLIGCTFDGRTSQMLAAQTFVSSFLIQNLARFAATPPTVLVRLLQQPMVRRQPRLKAMLLRHPNLPSESKRS